MADHRLEKVGRGRDAPGGFTLLELLVVLAILALIATLAVPRVISALGKAKTDVARIQIESLATTLDLYRLDMGDYPAQEQGLRALVDRPADVQGWSGPYLTKADGLTDPWGHPYRYRYPGQHGPFDLYSLGSDNAEGGEGEASDVVNW